MTGSIRPTTAPASVRVGRTANSAGATALLKKPAAPSQSETTMSSKAETVARTGS